MTRTKDSLTSCHGSVEQYVYTEQKTAEALENFQLLFPLGLPVHIHFCSLNPWGLVPYLPCPCPGLLLSFLCSCRQPSGRLQAAIESSRSKVICVYRKTDVCLCVYVCVSVSVARTRYYCCLGACVWRCLGS